MTRFASTDLRQLGQTDLRLSPLGLGTVKFGRNTDVKYPQPFNLPDMDALQRLLDLSAELGLNFIDTAPAYGDSEARLGQLLEPQRKRWIISTKVGEQYHNGHSSFDFSMSATRASIERSLTALKTDYLDIVLIHSDGNDKQILLESDVIETLLALKDQGMIRYLGASTKSVEGAILALELLDLIMITYHPEDISHAPVLETALERKRGVILKKVLGSGHSTDIEKNLAFALGHPAISSAIVGTINPDHLRQNVAACVAALQGEN